ncbi:RRXRR domain-containing protein [Microvirga calopogonii]|uniref:RRXRR domain-containing protein n=1 Tax=Microvirga calopogonii TaxID=2078013 RepID=UPI00197C4EBB|nr:RRXRR domain-containing protein [Microvirga calopogonii]
MAVYVLDKHQKPLMPCSEKRARKLLSAGRARVHRMRPFTIRLIDRTVEESTLQPIRLKIDPGSKGTGIALTRGDVARQWVLALIELQHRGHQIRDALTQRRAFRRRRRGNLRYRPKRFENRTRPEGWLAPSSTGLIPPSPGCAAFANSLL